jgi:hypothetical protein
LLRARAHLLCAGRELLCGRRDFACATVNVTEQTAQTRRHAAHGVSQPADFVAGRETKLAPKPAAGYRVRVRGDGIDSPREARRRPERQRDRKQEREQRIDRESNQRRTNLVQEYIRAHRCDHEARD